MRDIKKLLFGVLVFLLMNIFAPKIQESYRSSHDTPQEALKAAPTYMSPKEIIKDVKGANDMVYLFYLTKKDTIGVAILSKHFFGWQLEHYVTGNLPLSRVAKDRMSSIATCNSEKTVCFGVTGSEKVTGVTLDSFHATFIKLDDVKVQRESDIRLWYVISDQEPINPNLFDISYASKTTSEEGN